MKGPKAYSQFGTRLLCSFFQEDLNLKRMRVRLNLKQANKRFVPHAPVRNKRP